MSAVVYNVTCFDENCNVFWLDADGVNVSKPVGLSERDKDVVMNRLAEGHLHHGYTFTAVSVNPETPLVYDRLVVLEGEDGGTEIEYDIVNLKLDDIDPDNWNEHAVAMFLVTDKHGHMGWLQDIYDSTRLNIVGRTTKCFGIRLRHPKALVVAEGIENIYAADELVKQISFIAVR